MKHKKIYLNESRSAYIELYLLDSEISYKTYKKWPMMIICPGGAYLISATKEGEAVATQFLSQGYSCAVLRYSTFLNDRETMHSETPDVNKNAYYPTQILELLETIHLINENADQWCIDEHNIFATGFSAGGHIVGTVATQWNHDKFIKKLSFQPHGEELKLKGCILAYPMVTGPILDHPNKQIKKQEHLMKDCLYKTQNPTLAQRENLKLSNFVSEETSPIFLWHTNEDNVTDAKDSTEFILQLQNHDIKNEYHLYLNGHHGLGIAKPEFSGDDVGTNEEIGKWFNLAINWLKKIK
ncbi:alpha/beta hydrolase [Globicatella sulfidifaciens]|uniref:Alpha/beta hydrolase n=1 Tax=Globicatella sulfidifaciens TaxID=136093 RepID=A0A7X8C2N7_9LACT|nr:alpha/beta hydrolase [Globicatella sulfidifaciens]NLJ17595.1 alpha/beta hydrolase [Globicatella sulfidifaciens]